MQKKEILKIAQNMIILRIEQFWVEKKIYPKNFFGHFLDFWAPQKAQKMKISKKWKKRPQIFS